MDMFIGSLNATVVIDFPFLRPYLEGAINKQDARRAIERNQNCKDLFRVDVVRK